MSTCAWWSAYKLAACSRPSNKPARHCAACDNVTLDVSSIVFVATLGRTWSIQSSIEDEPLTHGEVAFTKLLRVEIHLLASHEHWSFAIVVRLPDVRSGTFLKQPLAHRQVAFIAGDVHGSEAAVNRLGDVRGRAHLQTATCTPTGGPSRRRRTWE